MGFFRNRKMHKLEEKKRLEQEIENRQKYEEFIKKSHIILTTSKTKIGDVKKYKIDNEECLIHFTKAGIFISKDDKKFSPLKINEKIELEGFVNNYNGEGKSAYVRITVNKQRQSNDALSMDTFRNNYNCVIKEFDSDKFINIKEKDIYNTENEVAAKARVVPKIMNNISKFLKEQKKYKNREMEQPEIVEVPTETPVEIPDRTQKEVPNEQIEEITVPKGSNVTNPTEKVKKLADDGELVL